MKTYVVFNAATGLYLNLDGPFEYPRWVSGAVRALAMSYARAHAYAAAYGGDVRSTYVAVDTEARPGDPSWGYT